MMAEQALTHPAVNRAIPQSGSARIASQAFGERLPDAQQDGASNEETADRYGWRTTELRELGVEAESALCVVREQTDGSDNRYISFGDRDADAARLFLTDSPAAMVLEDGQARIMPPRKAQHTSLRNLRPSLHLRADHALDVVSFIVPSGALERWSEESADRRLHRLEAPREDQLSDEVIAGFGLALLPSLERPDAAPRLFVDHVLHAVCDYLVRRFGRVHEVCQHKGGLAPWQERRAKEMIAGNLSDQLSLRTLATECRLSISHFTKAFRESIGQSPHQWLLERRVEQARTMLITTEFSLTEIASQCGFADQSHFSRAFAKRAGVSPGVWRRAHSASSIN